jgi:hypothetical protein
MVLSGGEQSFFIKNPHSGNSFYEWTHDKGNYFELYNLLGRY